MREAVQDSAVIIFRTWERRMLLRHGVKTQGSRWPTLGRRYIQGFTIAETVVALGIVAIALGAVVTLNSNLLRIVKSARETNSATLALQERSEQLRIANWLKVTDAAYVRDTFLASRALSADGLAQVTERVTIRDYNPDPAAQPRVRMVVEKKAGESARVIESGDGLLAERLARVDLRMAWRGSNGRERIRESSTVISAVGISRLSLPGFTGNSGSFSDFPTPITATDSNGNTVTFGGGGSSGTTTNDTPIEDTESDTDILNPKKGHGQGTVGGAKGKDK